MLSSLEGVSDPCVALYRLLCRSCVVPWLRVNKICPVCKTEVTARPAEAAAAAVEAPPPAATPIAAAAAAAATPPPPALAASAENAAEFPGEEPRRALSAAQALLLRQPLQEAQSSSSPATPVDQQTSTSGLDAAPSKRGEEPAVVSGLSTPAQLRLDVTPPPPAQASVPAAPPRAPVAPTRMRLPR